MHKAYKSLSAQRALRVALESDYLDSSTLAEYCSALDCLSITADMFISIYRKLNYPVINIDEYFNYIELMGIDITQHSQAREESFLVLLGILEIKYGIEYVDYVS